MGAVQRRCDMALEAESYLQTSRILAGFHCLPVALTEVTRTELFAPSTTHYAMRCPPTGFLSGNTAKFRSSSENCTFEKWTKYRTAARRNCRRARLLIAQEVTE